MQQALPRPRSCIAQLEVGEFQACARTTGGALHCWVVEPPTDPLVPVEIAELGAQVVDVSAGTHLCAVKTDGTLWCWGRNQEGQLGDGTLEDRDAPAQVESLGDEVAGVAAGQHHTCAVKTDGTLWCWGSGERGELGIEAVSSSPTPQRVTAREGVTAVAAGVRHTCAITNDGMLSCWGANTTGEVGDGTTTQRDAPVDVLPAVRMVSAGTGHTCAIAQDTALSQDTSLYCWGWDRSGQINRAGFSPTRLPFRWGVVAEVATGTNDTYVLKTDGTLWLHGYASDTGVPGYGGPLENSMPVTHVDTGGGHTCRATADGAIDCWGLRDPNDPTVPPDVVELSRSHRTVEIACP